MSEANVWQLIAALATISWVLEIVRNHYLRKAMNAYKELCEMMEVKW